MKIFVINSDHSEVPLAEVRTDGRILEFVVDNTNGNLPRLFQNSYDTMVKVMNNSSHMTMEEPQKATVNLLRYVMDNGDVVEITTDGHTVLLNGTMIGQQEKDALFAAVKRGEIKVARKTDIQQAIPVIPSKGQAQEIKPVKNTLSPEIMDMVKNDQDKIREAREMSSQLHDEEIENAQLHEAEDKDWTRAMMYWLKYGDGDYRK